MGEDLTRFKKLDFEGFRRLAEDSSLNIYEKIGFPPSYRHGKESAIFQDIVSKLPNLTLRNQRVVDVGPGCSELPHLLIDLCAKCGHELILIDSPEMLNHLPDAPNVRKVPGRFPQDCGDLLQELARSVNVVLSYSVLHYVFVDASVFEFLDSILELLAVQGEALLGDIPNVSKRKRFFTSPTGITFHKEFMRTTAEPEVLFHRVETGEIDDAVVMSLIARGRSAGFDTYAAPQAAGLPMANRREDILIKRP